MSDNTHWRLRELERAMKEIHEGIAPTAESGARSDAYERGKESGRISQLLSIHGERLVELHSLITATGGSLQTLTDSIRKLAEEARLRDASAIVAAATLAEDTERRRSKLAEEASAGDRRFTRRERVMALALSAVVVLLGVLPYLAKQL